MGGLFSVILRFFKGKTEARLMMVGLDNAGKSTIVGRLHFGKIIQNIRQTIGFNLEELNYKHFKLKVWDLSGQYKLRTVWKHYYQNVNGVVFVIDSSNSDRFNEARDEFHKVLADQDVENQFILVFANKQDLPNSIKGTEIKDKLGIPPTTKAKILVQECSAVTNLGIEEGFIWLLNWIEQQMKK